MQRSVFTLLVVLLGLTSYSTARLHLLAGGVQVALALTAERAGRIQMQTVKQIVKNNAGEEIEISTTRLEDEALDVWRARHEAAVAEFKES